MGAIRLDGFERLKPQVTTDNFNPRIAADNEYVWRDVKFDLEIGDIKGTSPTNKGKNTKDIADIRDLQAIVQSVTNIFNTTPGQKLLNPWLGIDLTKYLFDPISVETGDLIARSILKGLEQQEPRVTLSKLFIEADEEQNQYTVQFILEFPSIDVGGSLSFTGVLNRSGMKIQN